MLLEQREKLDSFPLVGPLPDLVSEEQAHELTFEQARALARKRQGDELRSAYERGRRDAKREIAAKQRAPREKAEPLFPEERKVMHAILECNKLLAGLAELQRQLIDLRDSGVKK